MCKSYDYKVSCSDCHAKVSPPAAELPARRHRLLSAAADSLKALFAL